MGKTAMRSKRAAPVAAPRQCFVIGPFGEEKSDIRKWSDALLDDVIKPLGVEFGYQARRSIDDARPRDITDDMVSKLIVADLVIADLTMANANVYYELAVRHALERPFIHVIQSGQKPPFDIGNLDVLSLPTRKKGRLKLPDPELCIQRLRAYFESVKKGTGSYSSILSGREVGKSLGAALVEHEAKREASDKNWLNKVSRLPDEITSSIIKYAAEAPMYYRKFTYDIGLKHVDGKVVYDMKVSFELVNVSSHPQTVTSRYPKLSRVAQLKKVTIDRKNFDLGDPALYGSDAITVKHQIPPGEAKSIEVQMSKAFAEQDSDLFTAYSYPSSKFTFRVLNRSPASLKCWVEMLNNQGTLVKRRGNSLTWSAERPLLPNQGVRLLWRPSDETGSHQGTPRTRKGPRHGGVGQG